VKDRREGGVCVRLPHRPHAGVVAGSATPETARRRKAGAAPRRPSPPAADTARAGARSDGGGPTPRGDVEECG